MVFTLLSLRNLSRSHFQLNTKFENLSKPHLLLVWGSLKNFFFYRLSLIISQKLSLYWVWGSPKHSPLLTSENSKILTISNPRITRLHVLIDNFNIDINISAARNQYCLDQCSNVKSAMWQRISRVKTLFKIYFTSICTSWVWLTSMLQCEGVLKFLIIKITY